MTPTQPTIPQTIILLSLSRGEQPPIIPPVTRKELLRKRWIAHAGTRPVSNGGERPTFEITEAGEAGAHDVATSHRGAEADRLRGKEQTMARVDLDELERKAMAATPGPWQWDREGRLYGPPRTVDHGVGPEVDRTQIIETDSGYYLPDPPDREHIAANSPPVTLALVTRIRELEDALGESLTLLDETTEDTPGRVHAIRCRELRPVLNKGVVTP